MVGMRVEKNEICKFGRERKLQKYPLQSIKELINTYMRLTKAQSNLRANV